MSGSVPFDSLHTRQEEHMNKIHTKRIPQRPRDVYIKAQPVKILPKELRTEAFRTVCSRFKWLHWALEVGPWTIEVTRESKMSDQISIRLLHHSECDKDWEDELDRTHVGQSTLRDEEIKDRCEPKDIQSMVNADERCCPDLWFQSRNQVYDLERWNCQSVATSLAVVISDDGFGTWDIIEHLSFFDMGGMSYSLDILQSFYGLRWFEPRLLTRSVRGFIKAYVAEKPTTGHKALSKEEAMNQAIVRFNKRMVEIHRLFSCFVASRGSE